MRRFTLTVFWGRRFPTLVISHSLFLLLHPSVGSFLDIGWCASVFVRLSGCFSERVMEQFQSTLGTTKLTYKRDNRLPCTGVFSLSKEDHTLCNMVSKELLRDPHVKFASYRIPHPLNPLATLTVSTDSTTDPPASVILATQRLLEYWKTIHGSFVDQLARHPIPPSTSPTVVASPTLMTAVISGAAPSDTAPPPATTVVPNATATAST
jgi:DNA-directed RNA polymerase II subunit RPB11